ncbi:MAG TPA: hypothetical protein VKG44_10015, partial [Candidatus Baltobacteraceae bacterium]|nr:hypothetical protein [Candidatus Baltobacteraceae bacterium]
AEGQTYIDKLALTNVNAGGTFSGEQALSPPTDLRANSANGLFPIVGYSPADGMLYASDTHGKLYRINPTTGASSSFPVDGAPAASDDPNRSPMALLPDNSLAYVGSANVDGNTASNANATCGNGSCVYIHVIPGTNPTATSFAPACSSTNAPCAYGIWSVETSGTPPNYGINLWSTDGGHIKASIW